MITTDYHCKDISNVADADTIKDLKELGNRTIANLVGSGNASGLLVFPPDLLSRKGGTLGKQEIFTLSADGKELKTGGIMGFVGRNNTRLTITSRFTKQDKDEDGNKNENDYFLHYMLQKVWLGYVFNFDQRDDTKDKFYDFLLYFFPYYLERALRQGLYKEYRRNEYNDSNIRGVIDVRRHIRLNIPFAGKVAYTVREYVYDNPVMQLVRHTIEYIKTRPLGKSVLNKDSDTAENVNKIIFHTNRYNRNDRQKIIDRNIKKPVNHPYFSEYRALQKICIRILQKDKITFGAGRNKIYGLLFDGGWLWEEYVNTIIGGIFWHPDNREDKHRQYLFKDAKDAKDANEGVIYPDFISKGTSPRIIADAKYKRINNIKGDDYLQLLAYMYRFDSRQGYYIYPGNDSCRYGLLRGVNIEGDAEQVSKRDDPKIEVIKIGLPIPQGEGYDFSEFKKIMGEKEEKLAKYLKDPDPSKLKDIFK